MVLSTKRNPFREALKKSKTIKNKRKSKSRTHRITRSKNLKGGSVIGILQKAYNCYITPSKQCAAFAFDSSKKIADLPSSITGLYSYVEIAKQLLIFYSRINIHAVNSPNYSELDKLKSSFKVTMDKLKEMISFLETNDIISKLARPDTKFREFITDILQEISNLRLSDVNDARKIAIWANWYRSKLENMISKLTAILTLINSIHIELPLNTSPDPAAPDPAATDPAAPDPAATANSMQSPAPAPAAPAPAPANIMQAPPFANSATFNVKKKQ